MDEADHSLVGAWRGAIKGADKSWVVFSNGTCVILVEPEADLAGQATELLRAHGPVHAGGPAGDFGVVTLPNGSGWVVTCHHNDILTFVSPEEVGADADDLTVGLHGRAKRGRDAEQLQVLHVEDRRAAG